MRKLVIFDLDGTLLYSLEDLMNSVNFALAVFGYEFWKIDNKVVRVPYVGVDKDNLAEFSKK